MERFGRYVLLRPLAEGGMGALFIAYDPERDEPIVLKRLGREQSGERRTRFLDEAMITGRLEHPKLVRYLDAGDVDGELYLALGFVPGCDLFALCHRAWRASLRVPTPIALHVAAELCVALAYAHGVPALDFVHRDVTPSNVLIGFDGSIRLADHGLAKARTKSHRTLPGMAPGTLGFVSPEQLMGRAVDARTDVYGVGAVLWFMLTSRTPYQPGDVSQDLVAQRRLAHFCPGLPEEVECLVYRALEPDPGQRFTTAAALGAALRDVTADVPQHDALRDLVARSFPGESFALSTELETLLAEARALPRASKGVVRDAPGPRAQRPEPRRRTATVALVAAVSVALMLWMRSRRQQPPPWIAELAPVADLASGAVPMPDAARAPELEPALPAEHVRALRSHGMPVDTRIQQARALARHGMVTRAASLYDELEQAGVPPGLVLSGRSEIALLRGDPAEAERLAALAITARAGVDAHLLRARALARLARIAESQREYREVLRSQPGNDEARRAVDGL